MALKMLIIAIIVLAYFMASDSARIRHSKTDGPLDATDALAPEDGAVSAAVGVEAEAAGPVFSPAFHDTVSKQLGTVLNDPPVDLSKTLDFVNSAPREAAHSPSECAMVAAAMSEEGRRVVGHVKFWKDQWGFLTSNEVQADIFVHSSNNPELGGWLYVGEQVIFDLICGKNGQPRAKNAARLAASGSQPMGGSGPGMTEVLASFGDGWGLLQSIPGSPLFVPAAPLAPPAMPYGGFYGGYGAAYGGAAPDYGSGYGGPLRQDSSDYGGAYGGAAPDYGGAYGGAAPDYGGGGSWTPRAGGAGRMTGTVKSFRGDWGFIRSDQHPGDIFVHIMAADWPLKAGEIVEFELERRPGNHNGACAANVTRLSGAGGRAYIPPPMPMHAYVPQALPPLPPLSYGQGYVEPSHSSGYVTAPRHIVSGTMVFVKDTWGFVKTASVKGDVFLGMQDNPQLSALPAVGAELSFELTVDLKSVRYKAVSVALSLKGTLAHGTVTKVRDGGGWGFAISEGVQGTVMVGNRKLRASGIQTIREGDVLEYELNLRAKGYEAVNIRVVSAH